MIPKSGHRFSEKIMLKTTGKSEMPNQPKSFRFSGREPPCKAIINMKAIR
jgi:hypothetical protein